MLERLQELKRRRRCEDQATQDAWRNIAATSSVQNLTDVAASNDPPPLAAHPTHALSACGGFYGCVRCGCVVGWQRHANLSPVCRGSCPRGSVRAIRRLAHGLHPFDRGKEESTCAWPSGECRPVPRRLRLGE